jgi:hypothetical protein|tara:strand:- start:1226 stop:1459 length:234 start_codon:yes stop_codon:yes gene_type:complete
MTGFKITNDKLSRDIKENINNDPIDIIESWGLNMRLGIAIYNIYRYARRTNDEYDLNVAVRYIEDEIERIQKGKMTP